MTEGDNIKLQDRDVQVKLAESSVITLPSVEWESWSTELQLAMLSPAQAGKPLVST